MLGRAGPAALPDPPRSSPATTGPAGEPSAPTSTASCSGQQHILAILDGYQQLCRWAARWPRRCWAIEGAHGVGRALAQHPHGELAQQKPVADLPGGQALLSTSASLAGPYLSASRRQCPTTHGFPSAIRSASHSGRKAPIPGARGRRSMPWRSSCQPCSSGDRAGSGRGLPGGPHTPGPGCPTACAGCQTPAPSVPPARPSRSSPPSRHRDGAAERLRAPHSGSGAGHPPPQPFGRHTALQLTQTGVPRQRGWIRPISSAMSSSGLSNWVPAHSGGRPGSRQTASHDATAAHLSSKAAAASHASGS